MRLLLLILALFLLLSSSVSAQGDSRNIVISGLVMRLDSLVPVPSTNVYIKQTHIGVRSSDLGLFSLAVSNNDTIVFSAVGSKTTYYIVPEDLKEGSYSIIQRMPLDTIALETVEVSAWPTIEQFNEAFTEEFGFSKEGEIVAKNSQTRISNIDMGVMMSSSQKANALYGNQFTNMYENAHIPLSNVLNPKRWDRLVDNWKKGK